MMTGTRKFHIQDAALALLFALFLGLPLIGAFRGGGHGGESVAEKRKLAPLPAWPKSLPQLLELPRRFNAFATDNFGFRNDLLAGYKYMLANVFAQSASDRAFVGRDGWLYVAGKGALEDMQGIDPFTAAQERALTGMVSSRGALLAAAHVRYIYAVMPDKHTVYPQHLPAKVYAGYAKRRLAALDRSMARAGHDYYVDMSDFVRAAAKTSPWPLYYKSDTHWNPYGGYIGYEGLVQKAGSKLGLRPLGYTFAQFRQPSRSAHGDLATMTGYRPDDPDIYPPARMPCKKKEHWKLPASIGDMHLPPSHFLKTSCAEGTGVALIFHDSFMHGMYWYVSRNYAKTYYIWGYPTDKEFAQIVQLIHPDVVIQERVERLMHYVPTLSEATLLGTLGLMGDKVTMDDHGAMVLAMSGGEVARTRSKALSRLTVDRVKRHGDGWSLTGWGATGQHAPATIIAVANGVVVGEAAVNRHRNDVASATRNPRLTRSGFVLNLPAFEAPLHASDLKFYFVNYDHYSPVALPDNVWHMLNPDAAQASGSP